jgi:hypothetical protein
LDLKEASMSENFLTAQFKGEPYEKQFQPKMFSAYFGNIKVLRSFLIFTQYNFVGDDPTVILGISYQVWITTRN